MIWKWDHQISGDLETHSHEDQKQINNSMQQKTGALGLGWRPVSLGGEKAEEDDDITNFVVD